MSVNKFVLNETSYFGKGAREELPEEIRKRKFNKVLVVTDKALFELSLLMENDYEIWIRFWRHEA